MITANSTPRKPAYAKCRMVPTTTCPADTGIAVITWARAEGLIIDIRCATSALVACPLISAPIWVTVAAGTCMPISTAWGLLIIAGVNGPLLAAAITCGAIEAGRWRPIALISVGSMDGGGGVVDNDGATAQ